MTATTIQIRSKGSITLPVTLRTKYGVDKGDVFTLIDMGDGAFMLTPRTSVINRLGGQVSKILDADGISLDDLLANLDDEREKYYQERYAKV